VLPPHQTTTGWIAISFLCLKVGELGDPIDSYAWLERYKPVVRVGRSILLYYIPGEQVGSLALHHGSVGN